MFSEVQRFRYKRVLKKLLGSSWGVIKYKSITISYSYSLHGELSRKRAGKGENKETFTPYSVSQCKTIFTNKTQVRFSNIKA